MPQIVEIPEIGELEFPDGMSQEQMADAIYRNFPQLRKPKAPAPIAPRSFVPEQPPQLPLGGLPTVPRPVSLPGLPEDRMKFDLPARPLNRLYGVEPIEPPKGFVPAFQKAFEDKSAADFTPFVSGAEDIARNLDLREAALRVQAAQQAGREPVPEDLEMLLRFQRKGEMERGIEGFGPKAGYMAGSITANLPAFIGELISTGGIYTWGRALAQRGAGKAVEKAVAGIAGKTAGKLAERTVAGAAGALAQAPIAGATRIPAGTIKNLTPSFNISEDELGKFNAVVNDPNDGFGKAFARAFGDQYIEVLSEHSGGILSEVLGKPFAAVAKKIPGAKLLRGAKAAVINRWMATKPGRTLDELFAKISREGGWHGLIGEMLEERAAEFGQTGLGLAMDQKFEYHPPTLEQLAAEAIAFSIPGASSTALKLGASALPESEEKALKRYLQSDLASANLNFMVQERAPGAVPSLVTGNRLEGLQHQRDTLLAQQAAVPYDDPGRQLMQQELDAIDAEIAQIMEGVGAEGGQPQPAAAPAAPAAAPPPIPSVRASERAKRAPAPAAATPPRARPPVTPIFAENWVAKQGGGNVDRAIETARAGLRGMVEQNRPDDAADYRQLIELLNQIKAQKGVPNAVPERGPAPIPVGQTPEGGPPVGGQVRVPEGPAVPQAQPQAQPAQAQPAPTPQAKRLDEYTDAEILKMDSPPPNVRLVDFRRRQAFARVKAGPDWSSGQVRAILPDPLSIALSQAAPVVKWLGQVGYDTALYAGAQVQNWMAGMKEVLGEEQFAKYREEIKRAYKLIRDAIGKIQIEGIFPDDWQSDDAAVDDTIDEKAPAKRAGFVARAIAKAKAPEPPGPKGELKHRDLKRPNPTEEELAWFKTNFPILSQRQLDSLAATIRAKWSSGGLTVLELLRYFHARKRAVDQKFRASMIDFFRFAPEVFNFEANQWKKPEGREEYFNLIQEAAQKIYDGHSAEAAERAAGDGYSIDEAAERVIAEYASARYNDAAMWINAAGTLVSNKKGGLNILQGASVPKLSEKTTVKAHKQQPTATTSQYEAVIKAIRDKISPEAANLIEFLGYIGARADDGAGTTWSDLRKADYGPEEQIPTNGDLLWITNTKRKIGYLIPVHRRLEAILAEIKKWHPSPTGNAPIMQLRTEDGQWLKGESMIRELRKIMEEGVRLANETLPASRQIDPDLKFHGFRSWIHGVEEHGGLKSGKLIGHMRFGSDMEQRSYKHKEDDLVIDTSLRAAAEKGFNAIFGNQPRGFTVQITPYESEEEKRRRDERQELRSQMSKLETLITQALQKPAQTETRPVDAVVIVDPNSAVRSVFTELDPQKLKLSREVPNFKFAADPTTGIVSGRELRGPYRKTPANPIVVWQRRNGDLEIVTGRHRWQHALKTKLEKIPVQLFKESDGFTADMAKIVDAESNILEGTGTVEDYENYFRSQNDLSEDEAEKRGLLRLAAGQAAWNISRNASGDVVAWWRSRRDAENERAAIRGEPFKQLTKADEQAAAIAKVAPNDEALQRVGIQQAEKGHDAEKIEGVLSLIKSRMQQAQSAGQSAQLDMFANDTAILEAEKIADEAERLIGELRAQLLNLKRLLNNEKVPEAVRAKYMQGAQMNTEELRRDAETLTSDLRRTENWETDPEVQAVLLARIQQRESPAPEQEEQLSPLDPDRPREHFRLMVSSRSDAEAAIPERRRALREHPDFGPEWNYEFSISGKGDQWTLSGRAVRRSEPANAIPANTSRHWTIASAYKDMERLRKEDSDWDYLVVGSRNDFRVYKTLRQSKGGEANVAREEEGLQEGQQEEGLLNLGVAPSAQPVKKKRESGQAELFGLTLQQQLGGRPEQLRRDAEENDRIGRGIQAKAFSQTDKDRREAMMKEARKYFNEANRLRRQATALEVGVMNLPPPQKPTQGELLSPLRDRLSPNVQRLVEQDGGAIFDRPLSTEELREVVNDPETAKLLSPDVVKALNALLESGLMERLPELKWMIRSMVGFRGAEGAYDPVNAVAKFTSWTDAETPLHEFFHHVYRFLRPEDRDLIRQWRKDEIVRRMATDPDLNTRSVLGRMLRNLDRFITSRQAHEENIPDDVYHLINDTEFFTWMMTPRAQKALNDSPAKNWIQQFRGFLKALWERIREHFGLSDAQDAMWRRLWQGKYDYDLSQAKAFEGEEQLASPKVREAYESVDRAVGQIQYAAQEAWRLAASEMADIDSKEAQLDAKKLENVLYKGQERLLKELWAVAQNWIERDPNAPEVELPNWSSGDFVAFLNQYWENIVNADRFGEFAPTWERILTESDAENRNVLSKAVEDIDLERSAQRLVRMREIAASLRESIEAAVKYYRGPGEAGAWAEPLRVLVSGLQKELAKVNRRIARRSRNARVVERADELQSFEQNRLELEAAAETKTLPLIKEIFWQRREAARSLAERFGESMRRFKDMVREGLDIPVDLRRTIANEFLRDLESIREAAGKYFGFAQKRRENLWKRSFELRGEIAKIRENSGMLEVLLDAVERAIKGDRDISGTTASRNAFEKLLADRESIKSFARALVRKFPDGGAKQVVDELLDPEEGELTRARYDATFGVGPDAFNAIIKALKDVPVYNDAVQTLVDFYERQSSQGDAFRAVDKAVQATSVDIVNAEQSIDTIMDLVNRNTPESLAEAKVLASVLAAKAERGSKLAGRILRQKLRELENIVVSLAALDNGERLFRAVSESPDLPALVSLAEEPLNFRQRMIVSNQEEMTFKAFGKRKTDLAIKAREGVLLLMKNFGARRDWFRDAEDYIDQWNLLVANGIDPERVTPEQKREFGIESDMTFNRRHYLGLLDAKDKFAHTILDPAAVFFDNRIKANALERNYLGWGYVRQFLKSAHMVLGFAGRDFMRAVDEYGNRHNQVMKILNDNRLKLLEARSAALESHPEAGNNVEVYRKTVFNEMASLGRQFGVNIPVGTPLPLSGTKVTQADLALLQAVRSFNDDLRSKLTERFGRGIRLPGPKNEVFVRRAASVGDLGTQMTINKEGQDFLSAIISAYNEGRGLPITATTDLGKGSDHPVVRFWNERLDLLINHILDAGRAMRDIRQDARMTEAERSFAAGLREQGDWRNYMVTGPDGNPKRIESLEDIVRELAGGSYDGTPHFPTGTGLNVAEFVRERLLDELRQYSLNARALKSTPQEEAETANIGKGVSVSSEFTAPATHFRLPSNLYDYGVVTDFDMLLVPIRAIHEPIVELSRATERAIQSLDAQKNDLEKDGKTSYSNIKEVLAVRKILAKLLADLEREWDYSDPHVRDQFNVAGFDAIKSSLLAMPTVNIKNMTLGQVAVVMRLAALMRANQSFSILLGLRNLAGLARRFVVDMLFSQTSGLGKANKRFLEKIVDSDIVPFARYIAEKLVDSHLREVDQLQAIGFSDRQPLWRTIKQIARESGEVSDLTEAKARPGFWGKSVRKMRAVRRGIVAGLNAVGTPQFDKLINAQSTGFMGLLEETLRQAAMAYGTRVESGMDDAVRRGEVADRRFDPTRKYWDVRPEEMSIRTTYSGKRKQLGEWIKFLHSADLSLARVLWRYYQAQKTDSRAAMFLDEEFNQVMAAFIRESNAGDIINRPTEARISKWHRFMFTFHGYVSDFIAKMLAVPNGVRGMTFAEQWIAAVPAIIVFALSAAVFGLLSAGFTEQWRRRFQAGVMRNITAFDKDFWAQWINAREGVVNGMLSSIPVLGDLALYAKGQVLNNRGYEFSGRVLAISLLDDLMNGVRGMWNMRHDRKNVLIPLRDFAIKNFAYGRELARAIAPDWQAKREYTTAIGAVAVKADLLKLTPERTGKVKSGIDYGPTYGIKEDLIAAMMNGETERLQNAYNELVEYYKKKDVKEPERAASRDFQVLHPAIKAFGNKKPTESEWDKVYRTLSENQKQGIDRAIRQWDWAASRLGVTYSGFAREPSPGAMTRPTPGSRLGAALRSIRYGYGSGGPAPTITASRTTAVVPARTPGGLRLAAPSVRRVSIRSSGNRVRRVRISRSSRARGGRVRISRVRRTYRPRRIRIPRARKVVVA